MTFKTRKEHGVVGAMYNNYVVKNGKIENVGAYPEKNIPKRGTDKKIVYKKIEIRHISVYKKIVIVLTLKIRYISVYKLCSEFT